MAGHRGVRWISLDHPLRDPAGALAAVRTAVLGVAAEANRVEDLRPPDLPGEAEPEPAIGALDLP
jgi:hypothetical protein